MTSPNSQPRSELEVEEAFRNDPVARALDWISDFDSVEEGEPRARYLIFKVNNSEMFLRGQSAWWHNAMADRALDLCKIWDPKSDDEPQWSRGLFVAARSLATHSRLIPSRYDNFADELKAIGANGQDYSEEFGIKTFELMHSLDPDIAMMFERLDSAITTILPRPERIIPMQRAGIALAYALGKATQEPELAPGLLK